MHEAIREHERVTRRSAIIGLKKGVPYIKKEQRKSRLFIPKMEIKRD